MAARKKKDSWAELPPLEPPEPKKAEPAPKKKAGRPAQYGEEHAKAWWELQGKRWSLRRIADAEGVKAEVVRRHLKKYPQFEVKKTPKNVEPKKTLEEELAIVESMSIDEQRLSLTRFAAKAQREAENYKAEGEAGTAARYQDLYLKAMARLDRLSQGEVGDSLIIPRDEIKTTAKDLRKKVASLVVGRPLLCAHCSRELSIRWAKDEEDEPKKEQPS